MQHLAHNGAWPNDRDLHHNVVELFWLQPRQAGHLRAALHLKHSDGVGILQGLVDRMVVLRQMSQVHVFVVMFLDQRERFLQYRHHAQPQQIHFDKAQVRAIFFVPLDHHAPRHGGRLERHNPVELPLADHHAAGVLPQMARKILCGHVERKKFLDARVGEIVTGLLKLLLSRIAGIAPTPARYQG